VPTIKRIGAYRFFFYSGDGAEPPHVHVQSGEKIAKIWLSPVRLGSSGTFRPHEISRIVSLVEEYQEELLEAWYDYFGT